MKSVGVIVLAGAVVAAAVAGGQETATPPEAAPKTGTIEGTLQTPWLRRYDLIVVLAPLDPKAAPSGAPDREGPGAEQTKPKADPENPEAGAGTTKPSADPDRPAAKPTADGDPEGPTKARAEPAAALPTLDQKNKRFEPHVMALRRGATLRYMNHDDVKHNVYFVGPDGTQVNLGTGDAEWHRDHRLDQAGVYAHRCNIHEEMSAYIVTFEHPWFVLLKRRADKEPATFKIENLPPGKYRARVWCERFYADGEHKFNRTWDVEVEARKVAQIALTP